jgi:hypothetical protein
MLHKLENLDNYAELESWAIFLSVFIVAFVSWFWFISKRTGRPVRDLLTLFAAAITVVALMLSFLALEPKHWNGQRHASPAEYLVFVALALSVTWTFNKVAKGRSKKTVAPSRTSR